MDAFTSDEAVEWMQKAISLGFPHLMVARFDWPRWSALEPKAATVQKTRRVAHFASEEQATSRDAAAEVGALLPVLAAAPPGERQAMLAIHVVKRVAKVLGTSSEKVDSERPLTEMGIDSLMAVELQTIVDRDFGVSLPLASLLEGATARQLTVTLLDQLNLDSTPPAEWAATTDQPTSPDERERAETAASRSEAVVPAAGRAPQPEPSPLGAAGASAPQGEPLVVPVQAAAAAVSAPSSAPADSAVDYASLNYGRWSPLQRLSQTLIRGLLRLGAAVDVQGLENIPRSGSVLVAVNHLSMLDVPLLLTILPRRVICIATDRLRRYPWLRWSLDIGDTIYVHRGEADQRALAQGLAVLRAGGMLGLAPEGARSRTGALMQGQSGVAYMAAEAPAPILPIVAYGQEQVVGNLKRLRRTRVHVRIGSLISVSPSGRTAARLQRDTERVMTALAEMLPPAYRGVYADAVERSQSTGAVGPAR
jgi:1-acyl-sn-glycerol-3-phosphate acyltransferase